MSWLAQLFKSDAPPSVDWLDTAADSLIKAPRSPRLKADCRLHCFGTTTSVCDSSSTYGVWTLCEEVLTLKERRPLVYSIGIGSAIGFDVSMVRSGARVRAFDPTITHEHFLRLVSHYRLTPVERARLTFQPIGMASAEGMLPFFSLHAKGGGSLAVGERANSAATGTAPPPAHKSAVQMHGLVARLPTLQLLAGDANRTIDVLKIDIEGAEWPIFASRVPKWLRMRPPDQIALELHERWRKDGKALRAAVHRNLRACGYVVRHNSTSGEEILFVRTKDPTPACAA